MKRFEEFVVTDWKEWDDIGDGYQFGGCTLNPNFFVGREEDLARITEMSSTFGVLPSVCFIFGDNGFVIEIDLWREAEDGTYHELGSWTYEGIISRGNKIS